MMDFDIDEGSIRLQIERLESDMSAMIQRHAAEVKGIESMLAESRNNDLYSMRLLAESQERIKQLENEVAEQCRLNGMGSEREARLMAQLAECRRKVLNDIIAEWEKPYGLTDGTSFITRLRRMAEES